jgi:hypothetical protein
MENIKITKSLADAARKAHDSADETGKAETTEIAVIVASHPGYFLGNHFIEGDQELVAMTLQEVEIHQAQPLTICRVRMPQAQHRLCPSRNALQHLLTQKLVLAWAK